jgi:hypothetical protein
VSYDFALWGVSELYAPHPSHRHQQNDYSPFHDFVSEAGSSFENPWRQPVSWLPETRSSRNGGSHFKRNPGAYAISCE